MAAKRILLWPLFWFVAISSADQAVFSLRNIVQPDTRSCAASSDCPRAAICFKNQCACQLGHEWNANKSRCTPMYCDIDPDCWSWPHANCGPMSHRCMCADGYILDQFHLKCYMSAGSISLIVFLSILGLLLFCGICCHCINVCFYTAAVQELATEPDLVLVIDNGSAKQKAKAQALPHADVRVDKVPADQNDASNAEKVN